MRAGISLGSNLGDRAAHLSAAVESLRQLSTSPATTLVSSFHETRPVDCPPNSPPFLNAAAEIDWTQPPRRLLEHLQKLEAAHGRPAARSTNAPRPLDLDLLYCGDHVIDEPNLILPHPRLTQRSFVLAPLAEICPEFEIPGTSRSVQNLLATLS